MTTVNFLFEHAFANAPEGQLWVPQQLECCVRYIEANWWSQTVEFQQDMVFMARTTTEAVDELTTVDMHKMPKTMLAEPFRACMSAEDFNKAFVENFANKRLPFLWLVVEKDGKQVYAALVLVCFKDV